MSGDGFTTADMMCLSVSLPLGETFSHSGYVFYNMLKCPGVYTTIIFVYCYYMYNVLLHCQHNAFVHMYDFDMDSRPIFYLRDVHA